MHHIKIIWGNQQIFQRKIKSMSNTISLNSSIYLLSHCWNYGLMVKNTIKIKMQKKYKILSNTKFNKYFLKIQ